MFIRLFVKHFLYKKIRWIVLFLVQSNFFSIFSWFLILADILRTKCGQRPLFADKCGQIQPPKIGYFSLKRKQRKALNLLGFPLFLRNETSGIRTRDNLIKRHILNALFYWLQRYYADKLRTIIYILIWIFCISTA